MTRPHRTAINIVFVSLASVLQIGLQFLFSRAIAGLYGAGAETDALAAALVLPTVAAAIITGSLAYVLIPDLVARFENEHRGAWELASAVGLITLGICAIASLLLAYFAEPICDWLYGDMLTTDRATTAVCLRILSVQVVLSGGISWAQAVLHSRHQFLMAALGGVLGLALSLGIANALGGRGITVIAWAINAGSLTSLMLHILPLARKLGRPRIEQATMIRLFAALWPLLLGAAFLRLDPLVDRVLAAELDTGSITHIHFAQRIMAALLALGTSSLALVAFPQFAEHYTAHGQQGLAKHLALSARRLCLLVVPIAIGVSLFATEIVSDLLERGRFTADDSHMVGWLVIGMMGMFVGASSGELLARAFYVLGDTKTPTFIGVGALLVALLVKLLLFKYLIGIWGIALGVSFYFLLSATIMACVLTRKLGLQAYAGMGKNCAQSVLASLLACLGCYVIYASGWLPPALSSTWVAGPAGAILYVASLLAAGNDDARQLWTAVRRRRVADAAPP